jgi:hypothetical protein
VSYCQRQQRLPGRLRLVYHSQRARFVKLASRVGRPPQVVGLALTLPVTGRRDFLSLAKFAGVVRHGAGGEHTSCPPGRRSRGDRRPQTAPCGAQGVHVACCAVCERNVHRAGDDLAHVRRGRELFQRSGGQRVQLPKRSASRAATFSPWRIPARNKRGQRLRLLPSTAARRSAQILPMRSAGHGGVVEMKIFHPRQQPGIPELLPQRLARPSMSSAARPAKCSMRRCIWAGQLMLSQ